MSAVLPPVIAERELSLIRELGSYLSCLPVGLARSRYSRRKPLRADIDGENFFVRYQSSYSDELIVIRLSVIPTWSHEAAWRTTTGMPEPQCCPLGPNGFGWRIGLMNSRPEPFEVKPIGRNGSICWEIDALEPSLNFTHLRILPRTDGEMALM